MKQYCRYCKNLSTVDGTLWCRIRQKEKSVSAVRCTNLCADFEVSCNDALGINPYGYAPKGVAKVRGLPRSADCMLTSAECVGGRCERCGWSAAVAEERKRLIRLEHS